MVPGAPSGAQDRRVNALSVINDMQPKPPCVIADLHFDSLGLRVPERVAQGLARDLVHLIADQRRQVPGLPFRVNPKLGAIRATLIGGETFPESGDGAGK